MVIDMIQQDIHQHPVIKLEKKKKTRIIKRDRLQSSDGHQRSFHKFARQFGLRHALTRLLRSTVDMPLSAGKRRGQGNDWNFNGKLNSS